jgi:hypothetical protein
MRLAPRPASPGQGTAAGLIPCICAARHRVRWRDAHNRFVAQNVKENAVNVHLSLAPLVSLLAGILILVMPRLLNYIIALYLIVVGILGLVGDVRFM